MDGFFPPKEISFPGQYWWAHKPQRGDPAYLLTSVSGDRDSSSSGDCGEPGPQLRAHGH